LLLENAAECRKSLLVLEDDEADRGDVFTTRVLAMRPG
jgi:uncharacterized Fe-S cluster-containing protein